MPRSKPYSKVRNGAVRALIGSTQKMGTGTNVPKRLVALHHFDAPQNPAEVEQQDGRILRQDNTNEHAADPIAIGGRPSARNAIPENLGGKLDAMPKHVQERTRIPLGTYRGLRFGTVIHPQFPADVDRE